MAKEEVLKAAEEVLRAGDSYSLDWGLEKLLNIIKRNTDETAKALDDDYFPLDAVLPKGEYIEMGILNLQHPRFASQPTRSNKN